MAHKHLHSITCIALLTLLLSACGHAPQQQATVNPTFATLEDLQGHTVAVITGSTSDLLMSDTDNFSGITIVRCATPADLLSIVQHGAADCGIIDTVTLTNFALAQYGLAVDFNLPGGFDVAAAFDPTDEQLCNQFNDFLVQVKSDGTLDDMFARWGSAQLDTVVLPAMPGMESLQGHPIEVAVLTDNPPFSFYRENHWTGLEVELIMRFGLFINRPMHFSAYQFNEVIPVLKSNEADMAAAGMFITPERSAQVLFSHPYYFCKTCCISHKQ